MRDGAPHRQRWHLPVSALQGESDDVQATSLATRHAAVARYLNPDKASPEQNARPDVVPRHEHIGTERECAENAPERYRDPPKNNNGPAEKSCRGAGNGVRPQ